MACHRVLVVGMGGTGGNGVDGRGATGTDSDSGDGTAGQGGPRAPTAGPPPRPALTTRLVVVLALGSGLSVASNYYVQPLLPALADGFGVSSSVAGLLVTVSQIGYLVGLVLVVPLGDLRERRRLLTVVTALTAGGLAAVAAAPSLAVLFPAVALVGLTSVAAQIYVPLAADLAAPAHRGRAIGTVMAGVLIGILAARTLAGVIAQLAGWRAVYVVASALMLGLAAVSWRELPTVAPSARTSYRALLASVVTLYREEPVLRRRGVYGALGFASFSVLWTSIAFLLDDAYGYGEAAVGLFGLLGVAGAVAAQFSGRLADRGWARVTTLGFFVTLALSWAVLAWGGRSLAALVVGIVLLDLAAQGAHISNQSEVYRLRPEARSRLTTAYMGVNFTGGVLGSASSAAIYDICGWSAVCATGAGFAVVAVVLWLTEARWPLRRMRHAPDPVRSPSAAVSVRSAPAGETVG
jgi:predicted MFS family arabinose efflux permease